MVKLWKPVLQEENGQNHVSALHPDLHGPAGVPRHFMLVRSKCHLGVSNV